VPVTASRKTWRRPWLYPEQLDALFCPERIAVTEASTKSGKTIGAIAWLTEQAVLYGRPGRHYWWVAPTTGQAGIAFDRTRTALGRVIPHRVNLTNKTITLLANGAMIEFRTGENPDNLYGEDVFAAVIDEYTRTREEAWFAVRSTVTATGGPIRLIGNVKGRKNWGYQLARRAETGEAGYHYAKITADQAIAARIFPASELEEARRDLGADSAIFRSLYYAEAGDDEGNPFGLDNIEACVAPLTEGPVVSWGWDLAKSVDWTVGIGLDESMHTCAFERWQHVPWGETEDRIVRYTGNENALVDSTGVGDPVLEALQSRGRFEGLVFSAGSKQQLMEGLALVIHRRELRFPDGPIRVELEQFEYEWTRTGVRYSAPDGQHDDTVMALGLAVRHHPGGPMWLIA